MASTLKTLSYFNDAVQLTSTALNLIGLIPGVDIPDELSAVFGGSEKDPNLDLLNELNGKLDQLIDQGNKVLDSIDKLEDTFHNGILLGIQSDALFGKDQLDLYLRTGSITQLANAETYSGRALITAANYAKSQDADPGIATSALLVALTNRINVIRELGDGATSGEYKSQLDQAINAFQRASVSYTAQSINSVQASADVLDTGVLGWQLRINYYVEGGEPYASQSFEFGGGPGSAAYSLLMTALSPNPTGAGNLHYAKVLDFSIIERLIANTGSEQIYKEGRADFFENHLEQITGYKTIAKAAGLLKQVTSGQWVKDVDGTVDSIIEANHFIPDTFEQWPGFTAPHTLEGRKGNDVVIGGEGDDTLRGGGGNPSIYGTFGDGNDKLYGRGGDDIMVGGTGDDWLDGESGNDRFDGGDGIDTATYYWATNGVTVSLDLDDWQDTGYGKDRLQSIENLEGSYNYDDKLTGSAGNNTIRGFNGNDIIDGRQGADMMYGGGGDDTYVVDRSDDLVFEQEFGGTDSVSSLVSYKLAAGQEIEVLRLDAATERQSLNLTGNEFANTLIGNDGANVLDGGGGADTMIGGAGNDTYSVDNIGDKVVEEATRVSEDGEFVVPSGTDLVYAAVSYTLSAEVENLTLTGAASINGTGNALANQITGNAGANVLDGKAGADTLAGGGGDDRYYVDTSADLVVEARGAGTDTVYSDISYRLGAGQYVEQLFTGNDAATTALSLSGNEFGNRIKGNAGDNTLNGGLGADTLYGLKGKDTFVFNTALSSANVDHLGDFSAADDTIKLAKSIFTAISTGTLAAEAFKDLSVAGAIVDANDRILYDKATGALSYDADGSGSKAAVQFAIVDTKATLTHADFLIV